MTSVTEEGYARQRHICLASVSHLSHICLTVSGRGRDIPRIRKPEGLGSRESEPVHPGLLLRGGCGTGGRGGDPVEGCPHRTVLGRSAGSLWEGKG